MLANKRKRFPKINVNGGRVRTEPQTHISSDFRHGNVYDMGHIKILVLLCCLRYGHSPLRRSVSLGLDAVFMLGLCPITRINQSYWLIWTPSNGREGMAQPIWALPYSGLVGRPGPRHLPLVNLSTSSSSPLCPCGLGSMQIRVGGSEDKGGWAAAFLQAGFYLWD